MKLRIKSLSTEPNDRMTSQVLWKIKGDLDGNDISIQYLDVGNNAEYDTQTELKISYSGKNYDDVFSLVEKWVGNNESNFFSIMPSDTFELIKLPKPKSITFKPPKM